MRRSVMSDSTARLSAFIMAYPIFCFFVFISVFLLVITLALYFSALSYKWEKRCARMLIFSMVPVCIWMIYFYLPVFPPLLITIMIWLIYPISFFANKNKIKRIKQKQQAKIKGWTCKNCKNYNEDVFLVCRQCNISRESSEKQA